eukprot:2826081-Alexandrium_andersonii.AAC.1
MQKHLAEVHRGVMSPELDPAAAPCEKPASASQDDGVPSSQVCEALLETSRMYDEDNGLQKALHAMLE